MKKLFTILAVALCSTLAMAQTNQYFWAGGQFIMGNPIGQIDSVTFGQLEQTDSVLLYLPRTVKVVHDTVIQKEIVHDTIFIHDCDTTQEYMGHEYVDLGLPSGTLWATCNVGANVPEENGDYFAWGETSTKSQFTWNTYKYCTGSSSSLTKYCSQSLYGVVDNKTTLDSIDDAAHVNWGGKWRMFTQTELEELKNNCTWSYSERNSIKGFRVVSKTNNNEIFLPAVGYKHGNNIFVFEGMYGDYWTSTLSNDSRYAHYLSIYIDKPGNSIVGGDFFEDSAGHSRRGGRVIRPVLSK